MSLVTLAKYKSYLGIASNDTTKDTDLTDLQSSVEARVKEYLLRDIESTTYTDELYNGSGWGGLVLRQYPVTAVSSISVYEGIGAGNVETWTTLVEHTHYDRKIIPSESYSVLLENYIFTKGIQNYKITYTAGYSTIPSDIQLACKELMKIVYANSPISGNNRLGFLSVSSNAGGGSQSLSIDPDIEEKILKKIECYKAHNV